MSDEHCWINACLHVVFCKKRVDSCLICQAIAEKAEIECAKEKEEQSR